HQQQQFQQQPNRFQQQPNQFHQQQQQFLHQRQLKQQSQQQQRFISHDAFGQNRVASDMVTHVKHEPGIENPSESIHSQTPEQFQLSQFQNQYQNNAEDRHAGSQILPVTSQSDMSTSVPQNSQQIQQMLHPQSMASDSINGFSNLSV
ncbi:PREDICTED: histone acetyltransferase HAC1-like, partial [Camelina sativa]